MNRGSFGLEVQQLSSANDQVLVVAQASAAMSGENRFETTKVDQLFEALRLPRPANTSACLGRLRSRGLVTRQHSGKWALTPLGDQQARRLIGSVDWEQLEPELNASPGAEFDRQTHRLIPPTFAPPRWAAGIARLLDRYPFERNVFCMTRFPVDDARPADPLVSVIALMRQTLDNHGLTLHLASDRQAEDDLLGNVGAYMWACQYGIGILETRTDPELNQNVLIELGSMIVTGRRCAILRDVGAPEPPTDLSGQIYKKVDLESETEVVAAVTSWVREDLGL